MGFWEGLGKRCCRAHVWGGFGNRLGLELAMHKSLSCEVYAWQGLRIERGAGLDRVWRRDGCELSHICRAVVGLHGGDLGRKCGDSGFSCQINVGVGSREILGESWA